MTRIYITRIMGGGGSKPADVYQVDGYQIVTADGKQCLRVDPNKIVENVDENVKHTSLGVAWGACNPDDPWQIWNAKEDGRDTRKYHRNVSGGYATSARFVAIPGKISVHNVGGDGTKRFLYAECISSLSDQDVAACASGSEPFVKWFPDDYDPESGYFTNVYYKYKYRHWEIARTDYGDDKKVNIKYFINDSQADPNLYVNVCISRNAAAAGIAPCVPAEYLLFEPKGRKTTAAPSSAASPTPGPTAEWTAAVVSASPGPAASPGPGPGPAPPPTDSPATPPPPTTSALPPSPSYYYEEAPAPSPSAGADDQKWWKKHQTSLLIGGGVLLCLCIFMIMAFVLFM